MGEWYFQQFILVQALMRFITGYAEAQQTRVLIKAQVIAEERIVLTYATVPLQGVIRPHPPWACHRLIQVTPVATVWQIGDVDPTTLLHTCKQSHHVEPEVIAVLERHWGIVIHRAQ
ncbi:hypothetical protein D3C80_1129290 [compost metagenome]